METNIQKRLSGRCAVVECGEQIGYKENGQADNLTVYLNNEVKYRRAQQHKV